VVLITSILDNRSDEYVIGLVLLRLTRRFPLYRKQ
jgi:hypothetical protein